MPGHPYIFESGVVEGGGVARVVARVDGLDSACSQLMTWSGNGWSYLALEWTATRLAVRRHPSLALFAMGPDGTVLVGGESGQTEEVVAPGLRDLRWIGEHLYALGRRVYRREGPGRWVSVGTKSFHAIDGLSEDELFATGSGGEIWRCRDDAWTRMKSPTRRTLEHLKVVSPTLAYAAGDGALLRGTGDTWTALAAPRAIRGLEWFQGNLYVSTEAALFRLAKNDRLVRVRTGGTFGQLSAEAGVLWSFGSKDIAWTVDLETWHDVTP